MLHVAQLVLAARQRLIEEIGLAETAAEVDPVPALHERGGIVGGDEL